LGEHFDMILVDSPPVNLITDTQLLAASCDAVLLVARAFSTTRKAFENTVRDLAPFRVIGTILNGGVEAKRYSYNSYNYGHRENQQQP
jgi:tyrosine-protein kinase Etk/Wzc